MNWLSTNERFKQCVTPAVFKFVQNKYPPYMNEVFIPDENMRANTRNSFLKLSHPFWKTSTGQKDFSYTGPTIWNKIPEIFEKNRYLNIFKHQMKHYYLHNLSNRNLWNIGESGYALAIEKNVFLFIKQIFLHLFSFFSCFTVIEGPQ